MRMQLCLTRRRLAAAGLCAGMFAAEGRAETSSGTPNLAASARQAGSLFGFALDATSLRTSPRYRAVVAQQASIVVPENAMKWQAVQPTPDRLTFDDADTIAAFARNAGLRLRGHTLCWHRALPRWVEQTLTRTNAGDLLHAHIQVVAGRYAGTMHSWDVVNEAIAPEDGQPGGWRDSLWHRALGPQLIDIAFHAARSADLSALLCYNEYGLEGDGAHGRAKRDAVLSMLRGALQRGVPIGALGIQSHLRAGDAASFGPGLVDFLREVRSLGLAVLITELDVDDSQIDPADDDGAVAETVKRFLELVLGSVRMEAVLSWGVWDWPHRVGATPPSVPTPARRPLLLGPDGQPTAATWAVAHCFERAARR